MLPNAKSSNTPIEGPPFMCDNNSNAKAGVISFTTDVPRIISFKNLALTAAALVNKLGCL